MGSTDQNRSHGKIEKLPEPLKREVEQKLLDGETYENISEYLKEQGEEAYLLGEIVRGEEKVVLC